MDFVYRSLSETPRVNAVNHEVWIWQNILSPHMAALATALAARGHKVTYIAQQLSRAERTELGWTVPNLGEANFVHCKGPRELEKLASNAPLGVEHIFQGFRGNGQLCFAYKMLSRRNMPFWIFLEELDDKGAKGFARRAYYRYMFMRWRLKLRGVLAVGDRTRDWVAARGMPQNQVYSFAYFLEDANPPHIEDSATSGTLRILFVGQLIERKGIDILLTALSHLNADNDRPQLDVVGSGPDERNLKDLAVRLGLEGSVHWLGGRQMDEIPQTMAKADLLVLPSRYDGWGAVVTEALMAGTPVIATDRCGAVAAVKASGCGAVVPAGDPLALCNAISAELTHGPVPSEFRLRLAGWARCFGAESGAEYLSRLFDVASARKSPPPPPWVSSAPPTRISRQLNDIADSVSE